MRIRKLAIGLAVLLSGVLASSACRSNPDSDEDDFLSADELLAASVAVSPSELEFSHRVGESPCPQLVGRIRIRNPGRTAVTATVDLVGPFLATPGPQGGLTRERDVAVGPGETVEVEIYFDCSIQADFRSFFNVSVSGVRVAQVTVVGHVQPNVL